MQQRLCLFTAYSFILTRSIHIKLTDVAPIISELVSEGIEQGIFHTGNIPSKQGGLTDILVSVSIYFIILSTDNRSTAEREK